MATFSDDFNRADGDLGTTWDVQSASESVAAIVSNAVQGTVAGGTSSESYNGLTTTGDCYAKVTAVLLTAGAANNFGVMLCCAVPTTRTYYVAICSATGGTTIQLRNAGAGSTVTTEATNWATGQTLEMRKTGANNITAYRDNVFVVLGNDSTITSGRVGLRLFNNTVIADVSIDNFEGGDLNLYMPAPSWGIVQQAVARGAFF